MYALESTVPESGENDEAVKWCHKAAEQGDAAAQYNLGIMCASGEDMGYAAATDGENLKPVRLNHGEYIFSNEARRG